VIIISVDKKTNKLMCPRCSGEAFWNKDGDLECKECGYIYYMFSDKDNSFQQELL